MSGTSPKLRAGFRGAFNPNAKELFQNLIWPAAAGNVMWALLQLAISPEPNRSIRGRIAVLSFLAIYLVMDWSRSKSRNPTRALYWIGDTAHITTIVVFAIAVASNKSEMFLERSLAVIFLIGVIGHPFGVWETTERLNWKHRGILVGCDLVGLLALGVGHMVCHGPSLWTLLTAFVIVLVAWVFARATIETYGLAG